MGGTMGGAVPPPPLANILGGTMGGAHPSHPPRSLCSGNSVHSRGNGGSSIHSNTDGVLPPGKFLTQVAEVVLRISPAAGSATFGYIYLYKNERHQEDPITAYFNSARRDVVPIPCPDFNAFMAAYRLSNCDNSSSRTSHVMSSQRVSEFSNPIATTIVPTWTGCPPLLTSPALALPAPPLLVGPSPQPLLIISALALPTPLLLVGPSPQANPFSHLGLVSCPTKLEVVAVMMAAGLAKDWNQRRVAVSCKLVNPTVSQTLFSWGALWVAALPARAEFCQ
jgi:hypothetical protein